MTGRAIPVPSPAGGYDVQIGAGLFDGLAGRIAEALPADRYVIVSDETVAGLYGGAALRQLGDAGLRADLFTFPAGEASKSRATWAELTDRWLEAGVGRDAAVVALGGGVTGDLAAFTASTYMRGLPVVAVPTSLLAMLDSAVGGKTAVDTPAAKNAVGTFHHPRLVVVDPELLGTLPERHVSAGLAEAVKTAMVRDAALLDWIEDHAADLAGADAETTERLIEACVRIKADVVASDPAEAGVRQILNFGHTAGHALETLAGLDLLHGLAVGAGMGLEARIGEAAGVTEEGTAARLANVLDALSVPDVDVSGGFGGPVTGRRILDVARADKKTRGGLPRWVLVERPGVVARDGAGNWSHALEPSAVEAWLDEALRRTADVRDSAS